MFASLLVHADVVPQDNPGHCKCRIQCYTRMLLSFCLVYNALNQQRSVRILCRIYIVQEHTCSSSIRRGYNLFPSRSHRRSSLNSRCFIHFNRNCHKIVSGQNFYSAANRSLGKLHLFLSFSSKIVFQTFVCIFEGVGSLFTQIFGKLHGLVLLIIPTTRSRRLGVMLHQISPQFLFIGCVGFLLVGKNTLHIAVKQRLCCLTGQLLVIARHGDIAGGVLGNGGLPKQFSVLVLQRLAVSVSLRFCRFIIGHLRLELFGQVGRLGSLGVKNFFLHIAAQVNLVRYIKPQQGGNLVGVAHFREALDAVSGNLHVNSPFGFCKCSLTMFLGY
nr:MAG TPA: hypothetical protein [Bacteriophage sp.]